MCNPFELRVESHLIVFNVVWDTSLMPNLKNRAPTCTDCSFESNLYLRQVKFLLLWWYPYKSLVNCENYASETWIKNTYFTTTHPQIYHTISPHQNAVPSTVTGTAPYQTDSAPHMTPASVINQPMAGCQTSISQWRPVIHLTAARLLRCQVSPVPATPLMIYITFGCHFSLILCSRLPVNIVGTAHGNNKCQNLQCSFGYILSRSCDESFFKSLCNTYGSDVTFAHRHSGLWVYL